MQPDVEALATEVAHIINQALTPVLERMAAAEARLAVLGDVRDRVVSMEAKSAVLVPVVTAEPQRVDLTPVMERLATADTRLARLAGVEVTVGELRDRVLTIEAKAMPDAIDLSPVLMRLSVMELKLDLKTAETGHVLASIGEVQKDVAATRERLAAVEARPAIPGPPGEQGPAGKDGLDGKDGLAGLSFEGVYQEGQSYEKGHLVTWAGSSWHCNAATKEKPGEGSKDWQLMVKRGRDGRDGRDAVTVPVVSVGGTK